jgi:integrase
MSSVHKTKFGTHEVKYRVDGKPRSKSFKTKREAERWAAETNRKQAAGQAIVRRQDVPTLREFGNAWLARRTDLEASTLAKYAEWLQVHAYPELGDLRLVDLRPRRLAEWQESRLADGAGPAVLGKAQSLLGRILKRAVLPYEYLEANPVDALDSPAYRKREHRWITAAEVEALRGWYLAADDLSSATLVSILAYVGIRPQDALALEWSDVGQRLTVIRKVSEGEIKPGSKTGDRYKRTVYLPAPVATDLAEWRAAGSGRGLLFARPDGRPWTKTDWDNWRSKYMRKSKRHPERRRAHSFKLAAETVGLGATLKPYDLRHTAATLFAAAGWNHIEIARQLGHSPQESMRTYQHLIDADPGDRRSVEAYILEARGMAPPEANVLDLFGVDGVRPRASRSDSA